MEPSHTENEMSGCFLCIYVCTYVCFYWLSPGLGWGEEGGGGLEWGWAGSGSNPFSVPHALIFSLLFSTKNPKIGWLLPLLPSRETFPQSYQEWLYPPGRSPNERKLSAFCCVCFPSLHTSQNSLDKGPDSLVMPAMPAYAHVCACVRACK